jgi:hypothetical protein
MLAVALYIAACGNPLTDDTSSTTDEVFAADSFRPRGAPLRISANLQSMPLLERKEQALVPLDCSVMVVSQEQRDDRCKCRVLANAYHDLRNWDQPHGHRHIRTLFKQCAENVKLNSLGIMYSMYSMNRSVVNQSSLLSKHRRRFRTKLLAYSDQSSARKQATEYSSSSIHRSYKAANTEGSVALWSTGVACVTFYRAAYSLSHG